MKAFLRKTFLYTLYKELRGSMALSKYDHPSMGMTVLGVTGTDGKTTTCKLIAHMLQELDYKSIMIGTTGVIINGKELEGITKMTSYDPMDLQKYLAMGRDAGCTHAVLEVSSHALEQLRFKGIEFELGGLTNITEEHLDYHETLDAYIKAKKKLFKKLYDAGRDAVAIFPWDDQRGRKWSDQFQFKTEYTYGESTGAKLQAVNIQLFPDHTEFTVMYGGRGYDVTLPMVGKFNVLNTLAAISFGLGLRRKLEEIVPTFANYTHAPGRQEQLMINDVHFFIDFAHTPKGLEVMLTHLKAIKGEGRLFCLFGAPGMRDRGKRPKMGAVVDQLADVMIVTDDDADKENRWEILSHIMEGVRREVGDNCYIIPGRQHAMNLLAGMVKPGDVVLLAGKGHEKVIVTNFGKEPWSDREAIEKAMGEYYKG